MDAGRQPVSFEHAPRPVLLEARQGRFMPLFGGETFLNVRILREPTRFDLPVWWITDHEPRDLAHDEEFPGYGK
jgi:hypothetical protein